MPEILVSPKIRPAERCSRSGSLCAEAGQRAAAPFPAPLSPLAALILRCAPDRFLLTKPNTFPHNRGASVATLRWCSGSSRNAVRLPFGMNVQLHRNPQKSPAWHILTGARPRFDARRRYARQRFLPDRAAGQHLAHLTRDFALSLFAQVSCMPINLCRCSTCSIRAISKSLRACHIARLEEVQPRFHIPLHPRELLRHPGVKAVRHPAIPQCLTASSVTCSSSAAPSSQRRGGTDTLAPSDTSYPAVVSVWEASSAVIELLNVSKVYSAFDDVLSEAATVCGRGFISRNRDAFHAGKCSKMSQHSTEATTTISPFLNDFRDRLANQYQLTIAALNKKGVNP
jgi:hypothetical protein